MPRAPSFAPEGSHVFKVYRVQSFGVCAVGTWTVLEGGGGVPKLELPV